MRESQIEAYLVKRVKALGGEVRKVSWVGRRGAPDRVVWLPEDEIRPYIVDGCFVRKQVFSQIWVELKAPGVEPEPHQLREHGRMRAMGQTVLVIDSIEGVDEWLC